MDKAMNMLDTLIRALGAIEVKGETNLNTLLGCIQLARGVKTELQAAGQAQNEEPKD